jgi:hypothetical protein
MTSADRRLKKGRPVEVDAAVIVAFVAAVLEEFITVL